ncbi:putative lipoprotein [Francisella tularensis subsp. novicida]|nr:putative lipoprotein [Francisella tularensis subsp. novicida]
MRYLLIIILLFSSLLASCSNHYSCPTLIDQAGNKYLDKTNCVRI